MSSEAPGQAGGGVEAGEVVAPVQRGADAVAEIDLGVVVASADGGRDARRQVQRGAAVEPEIVVGGAEPHRRDAALRLVDDDAGAGHGAAWREGAELAAALELGVAVVVGGADHHPERQAEDRRGGDGLGGDADAGAVGARAVDCARSRAAEQVDRNGAAARGRGAVPHRRRRVARRARRPRIPRSRRGRRLLCAAGTPAHRRWLRAKSQSVRA